MKTIVTDTRGEVEDVLGPYVKAFAKELKKKPEAVVQDLIDWYDSYRFSPQSDVRVCNPVSVGRALQERRFYGFWNATGNASLITERLRKAPIFAMVPHEWKLKNEAEAKRYFLLFMRMSGATINAEVESASGRADAILETEKSVYIFEFKYGKSARAALKQIDERGYAKVYSVDPRRIVKVGVNYNPNVHGVLCEVVNQGDEVVNEVVNQGDEVVNEVVKSHPGLRKPELIPLIGKSRATVERALAALIEAGRIEFRGAPKTGGYYVRDESKG